MQRICKACPLCWGLVVVAGLLVSAIARAAPPPSPSANTSAVSSAAQVPRDLDELRSFETRVERVVAKVLPSTVGLRVGNSQGSGVIVSDKGLILTAGHLINKVGEPVTIVMQDGRAHKGVSLGYDRAMDSGMVKVTCKCPGPWIPVDLGQAADLAEGTWCIAVGHPFGFLEGRPPVVRVGRLLSLRDNALRTDCSIVAGDSGGPLFDLDGKLIGINSRIGTLNNMNYHVPIDTYRQNWDKFVAGQVVSVDLPGRDQKQVKAPFRPVLSEAKRCVVRVKCDGKDACLGTIVGPHGWIVTKASELHGSIVCRLRDGRELAAKITGVTPDFDLAMLKIDATDLPIISWSTVKPAVGQWVASAGLDDEPLSIGVISVPERKIPPPHGALGVTLADSEGGPKIVAVLPKSPAEKAGLKVDDVITHVNGKATPARDAVTAAVHVFRPGEAVKLGILRSGEKLELEIKLAIVETPGTKKQDVQNTSGTGISHRHDDFPAVLQHDSVLSPADCGGPLVDLSGKVIAVNIARAGRTETYSVSSESLLDKMYELMSGRLAPPPPVKPAAARQQKPAAKP